MLAFTSDHIESLATLVLFLGFLVGLIGALIWMAIFQSKSRKIANRGGLTLAMLGITAMAFSVFVLMPKYDRQLPLDAKTAQVQYLADVQGGVSKQTREDHYSRAIIHLCYPDLGKVRSVDSSRGEIVLRTSVESASYFVRYRIVGGRFVVTPSSPSKCKDVSS